MKNKRHADKKSIDWFRIISLAVALALATLPLTLSDTTIALFTMMKYISPEKGGDSYHVIKQGAVISLSAGTYNLPGGMWGIACKGANGQSTAQSCNDAGGGGMGGSAQGMFTVAKDSFSLVINTVSGGTGGEGGSAGGNGGAAQNVTADGTRVAFAGGGGGGGDSPGQDGGAGAVTTGGAKAGGRGSATSGTGSAGGAANDFSQGQDGAVVKHSCSANDDGGAGGGGGGKGNNAESGGGGGSSYVQASFVGRGRHTTAPTIPNHGTVNLVYLGEVTGTTW